jgi:hypothetical protein
MELVGRGVLVAAVAVLGAVAGWIIGFAVWFLVKGPTSSCVIYSRSREVCSHSSGVLASLCGVLIGAAVGVIVMTLRMQRRPQRPSIFD